MYPILALSFNHQSFCLLSNKFAPISDQLFSAFKEDISQALVSQPINAQQIDEITPNNQENPIILPLDELNEILQQQPVLICNKKELLRLQPDLKLENAFDILELYVFLYPTIIASPNVFSLYKNLNPKDTSDLDIKTSAPENLLILQAKILFKIFNILKEQIKNLNNLDQQELFNLSLFMQNWNFSSFIQNTVALDNKIQEPSFIQVWQNIEEYRNKDKEKFIDINLPSEDISSEEILHKLHGITKNFKKKRLEQEEYALNVKNIFNQIDFYPHLKDYPYPCSAKVKGQSLESHNHLSATYYNQELDDNYMLPPDYAFCKNNSDQNNHNQLNAAPEQATKLLFAEAGTGIGKTLGYLAPTLAFIDKNPTQQVLISTYSKTLQKQIFKELQHAFTDVEEFENKVTVIKGSNNYTCLLNYESLLQNPELFINSKIFLGVIARWLKITNEGDLVGGNLSPLAFELFQPQLFNFVINKKEECIYNKCKHFKNCFVMKAKYRVKHSNIVVSNHSFSLLNNCMNIKYCIFDEAHHIFNTADEIFSLELSTKSIAQLRIWLAGSSTKTAQARTNLNGIKARLNNLINNKTIIEEEIALNFLIEGLVDGVILASSILPDAYSLERITNSLPKSEIEYFLHQVYLYVLQKNDDINQYYNQESEIKNDLTEEFQQTIGKLELAFTRLLSVSAKLFNNLNKKLFFLEDEDKRSLEEFIKVFEKLCLNNISSYIGMLKEISYKNPQFIYRFVIEKEENRITNIAYVKNYLNPAMPFAQETLNILRGCVFTSATLNDMSYQGNKEGLNKILGKEAKKLSFVAPLPPASGVVVQGINKQDDPNLSNFSQRLFQRFGLDYLSNFQAYQITLKSPFDYKNNSQIVVLNSMTAPNIANLSYTLLSLFEASKGGGLAIFTAITRLRQVFHNINKQLSEQNITLIAQHINQQKLVNLIDMFKEDINSCLLGTDSARDGIDIPGKALRLVIFEKVPWPKPEILLKHRVKFMGKQYIDEIVRLKLRQAYGRLIRSEDDFGIFVVLDKATPSEILKAFPAEVAINKINLSSSISLIKDFFSQK
ncbi:ATP-dependent DNA helicase [Candidatus Hepatincolaceae symbiont of Richtersius coronifer]